MVLVLVLLLLVGGGGGGEGAGVGCNRLLFFLPKCPFYKSKIYLE